MLTLTIRAGRAIKQSVSDKHRPSCLSSPLTLDQKKGIFGEEQDKWEGKIEAMGWNGDL